MHEREARIAGGAGILFVIIGVVGGFLPGNPPAADKPIAEITNFFVSKDSKIVLSSFLMAFGALFGLVFAWGLVRVLRRYDAEDGLGTLALVALAATVAAVQVLGAIGSVPAWESARGLGRPADATVRLVYDMQGLGFGMVGVLLAVFLGAASLAILRTRALPAWVAWLGFLVGVANLITPFVFFSVPLLTAGIFLSFVPFTVWVLIASVMLLRPAAATVGRRAAAPAV